MHSADVLAFGDSFTHPQVGYAAFRIRQRLSGSGSGFSSASSRFFIIVSAVSQETGIAIQL